MTIKIYIRQFLYLISSVLIITFHGNARLLAQETQKLVPYKVITKEDISYAGCKRIAIRVTVPDEAKQDDVNFTLNKIISSYKSGWADVTVWAYRNSEERKVGKIPNTKGMLEYSRCN
jgi:hypothetical protein